MNTIKYVTNFNVFKSIIDSIAHGNTDININTAKDIVNLWESLPRNMQTDDELLLIYNISKNLVTTYNTSIERINLFVNEYYKNQ